MVKPRTLGLVAMLLGMLVQPGAAQNLSSLGVDGDGVLEIEADGALEWDQAGKRYIARGNAVARRGTSSVSAERLIAYYREDADSGQQVFRFEASGDVVIVSGGNRATGAEASYDLDKRLAVLSGGDLRLEADGNTITADDRLEYDEAAQQARAIGNAVVLREGNRLTARSLVANFVQEGGEVTLRDVEADGGVRITAGPRIAVGRQGRYDARTRVARLTGEVQLCEEDQIALSGNAVTVNMQTGHAELSGGSGQRSRVVFAPGQAPVAGFDPCRGLR